MITFLLLRARRLFWRRFNPAVRVGWLIASGEGARVVAIRRIGYGLMFAGLLMGKRRRNLLYATTVPADHSVRVRVVKNGRTIAAG